MYPSVKEVVPSGDFTLFVVFDNGERGILDMKPILGFGVFQRIKDSEIFLQSAIKKIKRAANKGKGKIIYKGKLLNMFVSWNNLSAKNLVIKLNDLGFTTSFSPEYNSYYSFDKAKVIIWLDGC